MTLIPSEELEKLCANWREQIGVMEREFKGTAYLQATGAIDGKKDCIADIEALIARLR